MSQKLKCNQNSNITKAKNVTIICQDIIRIFRVGHWLAWPCFRVSYLAWRVAPKREEWMKQMDQCLQGPGPVTCHLSSDGLGPGPGWGEGRRFLASIFVWWLVRLEHEKGQQGISDIIFKLHYDDWSIQACSTTVPLHHCRPILTASIGLHWPDVWLVEWLWLTFQIQGWPGGI